MSPIHPQKSYFWESVCFDREFWVDPCVTSFHGNMNCLSYIFYPVPDEQESEIINIIKTRKN